MDNPRRRFSTAMRRLISRFVVLGQQRTGSNLVNDMLNSHPDVVAFGEIFSSPRRIQLGVDKEGSTVINHTGHDELVKERAQDPVSFLERFVYAQENKDALAVGFKLFYNHFAQNAFPQVGEWLFSDPTLAVIHLKRFNLLRTLLSKRLANQTGIWKRRAGEANQADKENHASQAVILEISDCERFFARSLFAERQVDFKLRNHRVLPVYFEDLAHDPLATHRAICAFLGMRPVEGKSDLERLTTGTLRSRIENYDELKEHFASQPAAEFFDE